MKTAKAKISSTTTRLQKKGNKPFFAKNGGESFFSKSDDTSQSFFNSPTIQTKLTIGQPNDKYEQEADAMADKVVQRLATPEVLTKKDTAVQTKPLAATITPLVQTKCAACDEEEKLQKKEEEDLVQESPLEIQRKPIFESNAEMPDDDKNIQRKCSECEEEQSLQKKEEEEDLVQKSSLDLQTKPIFERNEPLPDENNIQRQCADCEEDENLQKKEEEEDLVQKSSLDLQTRPIFESNTLTSDDEYNVQRKCAECGEEDKKIIQSKNKNNSSQTALPAIESNLSSSKGNGSPLTESTRTQMESSFGADFSNVRTHNDSTAVQMSKDLNAQAFTHGNDIYFNSGKYDSDSNSGKHLLAHELTHVVQQGKTRKQISKKENIAKSGMQPGLKTGTYYVLQKQDAPGNSNLTDLYTAFANGDLSRSLALIRLLSSVEKNSVLANRSYMHAAARTGDFGDESMYNILQVFLENGYQNLSKCLEWAFYEFDEGGNSWEWINNIINHHSKDERIKILFDDAMKSRFSELFGDKGMYDFMSGSLQGLDLRKSLEWMFFEAEYPRELQWVRVANVIAPYPTETKKGIFDWFVMMKNFQWAFGDEEVAQAVELLQFTLSQKLHWMIYEDTNVDLVLRAVQLAPEQEMFELIANAQLLKNLQEEVGAEGFMTVERRLSAKMLEEMKYVPGDRSGNLRKYLWSLSLAPPRLDLLPFTEEDWTIILGIEVEIIQVMHSLSGGRKNKLSVTHQRQFIHFMMLSTQGGQFSRLLAMPSHGIKQLVNKFDEENLNLLITHFENYLPVESLDPSIRLLKWQPEIERDLGILLKLHHSNFNPMLLESISQETVAIFQSWKQKDEAAQMKGKLLTEFVFQIDQQTLILEGVFVDVWTELLHEIKRHLYGSYSESLNRIFQQTNYDFLREAPPNLPSVGDAIGDTVKGIPGGLAAGLGGVCGMVSDSCEEWFKERGKDWMEMVGYCDGDPECINTAMEWSAFAGGIAAEIASTAYGGPILKAKKVIDKLKEADEIYTSAMEAITIWENKPADLFSFFNDPDKLIDLMFGIGENASKLDVLERWVEQDDAAAAGKKAPAVNPKQSGLEKLKMVILDLIKTVKKILKPIFAIRRKFLELVESAGGMLLLNPVIVGLIESLQEGKPFKDIFREFADEVITSLLELIGKIRNIAVDFISGIDEKVSEMILSVEGKMADAITGFAMSKIETTSKALKAAMLVRKVRSEVTDLISNELIKPVLSRLGLTDLLKSVNDQVGSVIKMVQEYAIKGVDYVYENISQFIEQYLKGLNLQLQQEDGTPQVEPSNKNTLQLCHLMAGSKAEQLPTELSSDMENTFGKSFGQVKIHIDKYAQSAGESLHANAFTQKNDIFFNANQYEPDSQQGRKLIAHELTHVVQQNNNGSVQTIQRSLKDVPAKVAQKIIRQIEDRLRSLRVMGNAKGEIKALSALYAYLQKLGDNPISQPDIYALKSKYGFNQLLVTDNGNSYAIKYEIDQKGLKEIVQYKRKAKAPTGNAEVDWQSILNGELLDLSGYQNTKGEKKRIRPDFVPAGDKKKRSNRERLKKGLSPYLDDTTKVELHHEKQYFFSVLAELSTSHHKEDYDDLHSMADDPGYLSWRGEIALYNGKVKTLGEIYNNIRTKHWKSRAKEIG